MDEDAIFCGRCGYNVRDSKPNTRGNNADSFPVEMSDTKSSETEAKVRLVRYCGCIRAQLDDFCIGSIGDSRGTY